MLPGTWLPHLNGKHAHFEFSRQVEKSSTSGADLLSLGQCFYVSGPKTGQDLYLRLSPPALITWATMQTLGIATQVPKPDFSNVGVFDNERVEIAASDRSMLTPNLTRRLLARFDTCIRPCYPIAVLDFSAISGTPVKKLPNVSKFRVLIACAIAACHESYRQPEWRIVANVCRDWADELAMSIITVGDGDAILALIMLLTYEMADPKRGIVWDLLGLATRMCLQLGWHRRAQTSDLVSSSRDTTRGSFDETIKEQIISVLKGIDR